jgi:hypothetical protein
VATFNLVAGFKIPLPCSVVAGGAEVVAGLSAPLQPAIEVATSIADSNIADIFIQSFLIFDLKLQYLPQK